MSKEAEPPCFNERWQLKWETGSEVNSNVDNMIRIGNPKNTSQALVVEGNDLIFQGSCQGPRFSTVEKYQLNVNTV